MSDIAYKTREEIFELIKRVAQEKYPDADWTGLRTGSFEWLLSQIVAEVSDLNRYYLDLRANNAYIDSATIRKDIRDICANLGLRPTERSGAIATLTITATNDVTIPLGTRFSSTGGEVFSSLTALALSTGTSLTGQVRVVHGSHETVSYRARGDVGEQIDLSRDDVLQEHLIVTVDGVEWTQVDSWADATASTEYYIVIFDELNKASIKFGDGTYGKRIAADASIVIEVFYGGGPAGNAVGAGEITTALDTYTNSDRVSTITNTSAPTGGAGAESIDSIRAEIPSQLRQISGLINPEDISQVIKYSLDWAADATAESGHTAVSGIYVPTVKVSAFPFASAITGMSVAQSNELSDFLSRRGQFGVKWSVQDAYEAPIEMEIECKLTNKNLELQKEAEIKSALVSNTDAPFYFDNLGFSKEYTRKQMLNAIYGVSGVAYAKLTKFGRLPQSLVINGTVGTELIAGSDSAMVEIELGENSEDGYYQFISWDYDKAHAHFFRPVKVIMIGSNFVKTNSNWITEEHEFTSGAVLNDTTGPYLKINGSSKLEFKQFTKVWLNDQFNGSTYDKKYLLRVQWIDANQVTRTSYFHIADTTVPSVLTTVENAISPIAGDTPPTTFADSTITMINVQVIQDQTNGSTNALFTQHGERLTISYNDGNTLYVSTSPYGNVPVNHYCYIHFAETEMNTTTDNWVATTEALKMRLYISEPWAVGDIIEVYSTPRVAEKLYYKHPREVFTLSKANITIRWL